MGNFSEVHKRTNTRSVKWDMIDTIFDSTEVLPMWVADMDFQAPKEINDALQARIEHGIYGYTIIDDEVNKTVTDWLLDRHNWKINSDWLTYTPGVIVSLNAAIQAFTEPGDPVLIQPPVYTPFYNIIEQHDRKIVKNKLILKDNYYEIDFIDLEEKLRQGVKAFVFCSPHNPTGRVWTKEELTKIAELCLKYNVLIITDEIHSDLVYSNQKHIPIASLSEKIADQTITLMAPTKTFNLAGLQASYVITKNKSLKEKLDYHLKIQGVNGLSTIGVTALEAAYKYGHNWLDEFLVVLEDNKEYVEIMLQKKANKIKVVRSEGTYLLWLDCSELNMTADELNTFMIEEAKVGLNRGLDYGVEGEQFMRINIACPRATLEEGVNRIIQAVNSR